MRKLPQSIITKDPKLTALLNGILSALRSLTPRPSPTIRVKESANGTTFEAIEKGGVGGSVNYRGDYDPTKGYKKGDIVRQRSGVSQGVFICLLDNPVDLNTGQSRAPRYPEPQSDNPPTQNTWDTLSLGIVAQSACVGGSNKTIYINASQPF